ncbi:MAG: hypothetical protein K2J28_11365, partial [Duncaniella sp.]|nr:hypothetical protein [Duncaniella sp.]
HAPTPAELVIESVPATIPALYSDEKKAGASSLTIRADKTGPTLSEEEKRKILEEVDLQQQEFGIQK